MELLSKWSVGVVIGIIFGLIPLISWTASDIVYASELQNKKVRKWIVITAILTFGFLYFLSYNKLNLYIKIQKIFAIIFVAVFLAFFHAILLRDIAAISSQDILIMETGYNWNPRLPDGKIGQLNNNGPYDPIYPSSPAGQRDFLYECFNGLKNVSNGRIIGALYWDPVMIEVPGVGWELGADNVVSNTTLFDFNGNALEALKAFKFNN